MKKRNIIVHCHIFKNAGSTFDDSLVNNFGDSFIDHREDYLIAKNPNFLKAYFKEYSNIQAFSSHSVYYRPNSFDECLLHTIYFLRHPIERVKSVYSFEKKQPAGDSSGAEMAKKLDFKEYVSWRMKDDVPATIRNIQTIFLAGTGPEEKDMEQKYELALKHLQDTFLVGIVDRYDETMVIFEEYLKEFFPQIDLSYIRRNITDKNTSESVESKTKKVLASLGEELSTLVQKNNEYDMKLYLLANELLDVKINKIKNFKNKLTNFKRRCQIKQLKQKLSLKLYDEVKAETEDFINQNQKNIQYYLINAEALIGIEKFEDALSIYDRSITLYSDNEWPLLKKIKLLYKINEPIELQRSINMFKEKFPEKINLLDNIVQ